MSLNTILIEFLSYFFNQDIKQYKNQYFHSLHFKSILSTFFIKSYLIIEHHLCRGLRMLMKFTMTNLIC